MDHPDKEKLTRRKFIKSAASTTAIGAATIAGSKGMAADEHTDHDHQDVPPDIALRVRALETVLSEKGLIDSASIDEVVERYQNQVGPQNGARVVARAWSDPDFKQRLLADGTEAIGEMGFLGPEAHHMVVVENSPGVHNLVVCTLCSCYPWAVLGLPPRWYKSAAYRSRAVIDPRGLLREFGLALDDDTEVRVWDSTAEMRYLVLPERPAGTDGLSEEELADLVTRDAMVGVGSVSAGGPA
jgi:nitrile hydratase